MKSLWFRRLERELPAISSHLRLKRIKYDFYRIFFKECYIHEVYGEMTEMGYDHEEYDQRLENQQFFQELEDYNELTRKLKNYVEGYRDSLSRIKARVYMLKNDYEFYQRSAETYRQLVVK